MSTPLMSTRRGAGPAVEFEGMPVGEPTLDPSKDHTCHITLRNPTEKAWTYKVSLTLSGPVSWSSDSDWKNCPAGGTQAYDVLVYSGMDEGSYDIYVTVWCQETDEQLIASKDMGQDVIFEAPVQADVSFVSLSWD